MSDLIAVNILLWSVRLWGSSWPIGHLDHTHVPLVISACAAIDCSRDTAQLEFYHLLHVLMYTAHRTDIVILSGGLCAFVDLLRGCECYLFDKFGFAFYRPDNGDGLLNVCWPLDFSSKHQLSPPQSKHPLSAMLPPCTRMVSNRPLNDHLPMVRKRARLPLLLVSLPWFQSWVSLHS